MSNLSTNVRSRLSIMMFLQYAFNGIWVPPLVSCLGKAGYSGVEIGWMYATFALGGLFAPFLVGMIVDRFFSGQKVLGVLNLLAAGFLWFASQNVVNDAGEKQPMILFWLFLAHYLCYVPTWPLTNSIALYQMDNPGKQFPSIRVMGTFGWIAVSTISLFSDKITPVLGMEGNIEFTNIPMQLGCAIGIVAGLLSFFMPKTPPKVTDQKITFGDILGVKALALFKDRNFLVFTISTLLIMFPALFYWLFCNMFLNEIGMKYVQFKQSIGQMAEVIFLVLMPLFFARFGVKPMLVIGMFAWMARFLCFGFGNADNLTFMLYLGLALHGVCYDFFFVTGQLYTDKKAPKEIQAQAQGLISMITFGFGWFFGALLVGKIVDHYSIKAIVEGTEKVVNHSWQSIWMFPIGMIVFITAFFLIFFNDKTVVGRDEEA